MVMTCVRSLALGLVLAGAGVVSPSAAGAVPDIQAVMVRDMTIAVAPWIPCTQGRAAALSPGMVRARQAPLDATIDRTYAPHELTHAGLRSRLRAVIAAYGVAGAVTRAGEWNETTGRHNGVAFHYKPQAVIAQTDEAVL